MAGSTIAPSGEEADIAGASVTYCAFEDDEFPDEEFSADGEHLGADTRHLFTGELVLQDPGGNSPMESPDEP